jgi:hypothetical protein
MPSTSLRGYVYYVSFIDDYSRKTWVYFLKSKDEGIVVGYCEVSKAFRIYIPGYHHIEINRDVTFDEDATLKK